MDQPILRSHRSATGHHNLLPAAETRGTRIVSFVPLHTLFAWTFGSGTVFWRIWPAVLLHTLFATAVVSISMCTALSLGIPNVMLTVLGVVIGFVISYRASSGYDRYWMGRTAWSDVVKNTRTLTRLVWFHVPLRLTPKTPEELSQPIVPPRNKDELQAAMKEKRAALDLIEGFAVALKHHLRGESGIYYEDLYELVRPLHGRAHRAHEHNGASALSSAAEPWRTRGAGSERDPLIPPINGYGSIPLSRTTSRSSQSSEHPLLPASRDIIPSLFGRVSADLIPFASHVREIFSFYRSLGASDSQKEEASAGGQGGVQRRWSVGGPTLGPKDRPRVAGGGDNIPIEVLRRLSNWFAQLEERGTVPGTSLGSMIGLIAALEDSVSTVERILTTPLPFVYSVHIKHTVWLYLFFLPFQLVTQFGWHTIPGVAMASFIYLGFMAAGEEIEQPFGYDENDLDLDMFCRDVVHADIARLKETPGDNVFLGSRHEATPHSAQPPASGDLLGI